MTDYELIVQCKAGSEKAMTDLFFQYGGFLRKRYYYFLRLCPTLVMDFEDFQSEAYFCFRKAVRYVKLEKITNPSAWKFMTPFMWFIDNLVNKLVRQLGDSCGDVYFSVPVSKSGEANEDVGFLDFLTKETEFESTPEKLALQSIASERFMKTLKPVEQKILKIYCDLPREDTTLIMKRIAKEMGCSKAWVHLCVSKAKKRFKEDMQFLAY